MAAKGGHLVLRLPHYHCHFNPIELVWSQSKRYYDKNIGRNGYNEEAVLTMWAESLGQVATDNWSNSFSHVEKILNQWWQREKSIDEVQPLIITSSDDSSSDDFSD
jgi:transposase